MQFTLDIHMSNAMHTPDELADAIDRVSSSVRSGQGLNQVVTIASADWIPIFLPLSITMWLVFAHVVRHWNDNHNKN